MSTDTLETLGFSLLLPEAQLWRESNLMKIPNTNLLRQVGAPPQIGGRLWRMPPYSANTWHRHVHHWEWYFVLEGTGRMRVGDHTLSLPVGACALVEPHRLRQV